MSSSKLFLFSKEVRFNSGVRLLLELYCAVVLKHVAAFFTILAKLTSGIHMYQFTFEPLHLSVFLVVFVVSDLNKNFGGSTNLAKKRHGSADLHTLIQPPPQPSASADNTYLDPDYSGYHKNVIQ